MRALKYLMGLMLIFSSCKGEKKDEDIAKILNINLKLKK